MGKDEAVTEGQYRRRRRIYRSVLLFFSFIGLIGMGVMTYIRYQGQIPDELHLLAGREEKFDFNLPAGADIMADVDVVSAPKSNVPANQLRLDFNEPFTIKSSRTGSYTADVKLFGILPLKKVSIDVINPMEVVPCGMQIGIYLKTDGLLVLGTSGISSSDGTVTDPSAGILKSGDYILSVDGENTMRKEVLIDKISNSDGHELAIQIRRQEKELTVRITPVKAADGSYKIGAWIRDDTQGIGTMTYVTGEGGFGALGHGITDVDTGVLMDIGGGDIYNADIIGIIKGKQGSPGELSGVIHMSDTERLGEITANTGQGIFGHISKNTPDYYGDSYEVGLKQEVKSGKASILCAVDGSIQEYEIEIEKINLAGKEPNKGLVIHVTDEKLVAMTGGIVQGMSGSPILQDGKIIGAVTHVFIRDSTRGYGIFIENMLNSME